MSATVGEPLRALSAALTPALTLALEPSGTVYFLAKNPPKGLGGGGQLRVPVGLGIEIAGGYQYTFIKSSVLPMQTHHGYIAGAYRLDELKYLAPVVELGVGVVAFLPAKQEAILDVAGHIGAAIDFYIGALVLGVFIRYQIYILSGLTDLPAGICAGLRLGFKVWE